MNLPKVTKDLPSYKIVPDKIDTIVILFDEAICKPKYSAVLACSSQLFTTQIDVFDKTKNRTTLLSLPTPPKNASGL